MKIFYDHQAFTRQIYGGVSNYFFHLIKYIKKENENLAFLSVQYSNNEYLGGISGLDKKKFFINLSLWGKCRIMEYLNQKHTVRMMKKIDYSAFHPTYYDPYFLKYIGDRPFILTIFDMIHEKYIKNKKDKTSIFKKQLAQRAAKIIAISKSTKKDIVKILGIDEEKIKVIYPGGGLKNSNEDGGTKPILPERYILYVGERKGYKNFIRLLESIDLILFDNNDLTLLCVGGGRFDKEEKLFLKKTGLTNKVIQIFPQKSQLFPIYQKALLLVYPSLYEGFGLPVLEAFSCGCPLAMSNTSALAEVGGEAALYFNPLNEFSILETVEKLIEDKNLRINLINRGFEQLKKFSWGKMAEETFQLYTSL